MSRLFPAGEFDASLRERGIRGKTWLTKKAGQFVNKVRELPEPHTSIQCRLSAEWRALARAKARFARPRSAQSCAIRRSFSAVSSFQHSRAICSQSRACASRRSAMAEAFGDGFAGMVRRHSACMPATGRGCIDGGQARGAISPTKRASPDRPGCRGRGGHWAGRGRAAAARRDRQSAPSGRPAWPARPTARLPPCCRA